MQSPWRVFECSRLRGEGTMLQSPWLCFECSRPRGEGTMLQSTWRVFECSRPPGEGTILQSLGLCFECSRSRGEGTMLQIKCRAIVSLAKGILVSISCWSLMQMLRCVVSRDVTAPLGPTEKISVALLVNVLHYREEEKLDIVESRASVIGCRSMRRWQRSLLCAE